LRIDLTADLTPRDQPGAEPSVIAAAGLVRYRPGAEEPIRFSDLRVDARPLRVEHLAALSDQPNPLLRGLLTGGATLSGSPANLRIEGGEIVYKVGDAPETVLSDLSGTVRNGDVLRYELRARARPLALATLTELFPALPFRRATLAGPISITGNGDDVRFDADLQGAAGGIAIAGSLRTGTPMRFDVSGRVEAFRAGALVTGSVPLDGPLTGTFSARGTTEDLRFAVDMRQGANGSFALGGTVRRPGGTGSPQFDISGRVDNFRIGALIGRPGLLPGPVSGPIAVSGGGRQPYRFDVALTGQMGTVDVRGTYAPGDVPVYAVTGRVRNLDLSGLPGFANLPGTRLNGTLDVNGRGTTAETFDGRIAFTAEPGTTVGGVAVERGVVRVATDGGVLRFDTLSLGVRGVQLEASGQLGLTRAAPEPLRFTLNAPNLGVLAAFVPPPGAFEPEIAGSLQASGWVMGTLRYPEIAATLRGSGIQYQGYRAEQLAGDVRLAKGATVWTGNVALNGTSLTVAGNTIRSVELQANLTPDGATFGLDLRRDENTDLHASGALELNGLAVNAVVLNQLNLRLRDVQWTLAVPRARLARLEGGGYRVESLRLARGGSASGFIEANGTLPATGTADLMIRVAGLDLAELRQLAPMLPDAAGIVTLNAAITGPVERPRVLLDGTVVGLAFGGLQTDTLALNGEFADRAMALRATVRLGGRTILNADARVPMTLTLGGLVPSFALLRTDPLRATLTADSLPMQLVAGALPLYLKDGGGQAYAQVNVSGTLDEPTVAGTAVLANAAVTVVQTGVRLERMAAAVRLQGKQIVIDSAVAHTGGDGVARVSGSVLLDQPGRPAIDLAITTENFQAMKRDDVAELQVDAGLRITGRLPRADLTGALTIEDGVIYIPETGQPTEADIVDVDVGALGADTVSAGVATAAGVVGMLVPNNLEVSIGENVRLQSSELSVYVRTERPLLVYEGGGLPRVFGEVQTVRGTYTLSVGPIQRDFEIERGTVQFTGTPELNPRLDINAVHQVRGTDPGADDLDVNINLGGTLQQPTIALSSNTRPPLPQSELLSLLLFGRRSADLASLPSEFTQGVILEQLLGGVITSQLEQVFTQLGFFDYVRLRARPTGVGFGGGVSAISTDILAFASVEAGKQLFEDFYVVLEIANIFSEPRPGASFEYQASRTWSIRGAFEPVRRDPLLLNLQRRAYQFSGELRRRWEYGRPKVTDADVLENVEPVPPASDTPAPGQMSTPTGAPPPTPPEPTPD
ncbi:MAG TPA: translocation/assembly module TamB, partial [Longimicrobium sp.]|uniref:translocation/assembly module TamB domain-containing protein n=1 Tax=Longimicrobium sp. TaxID=2029185 RepID=UPI002EDAF5EE